MADNQNQNRGSNLPAPIPTWQGLVELAILQNPEVANKLTVASAVQMMNLPDASFGWVQGGEIPKEAKALAVITCLRYDLLPGSGAVFFLGNQIYISAAAKRTIANRGNTGFRWLSPRVPRPLNEMEKEMLGWKEGDRALAVECEIEVHGVTEHVVGYSIVEAEKLALAVREPNKTPGLQNKSNIYQTLFTRAERDILKRYLPMDVPEEAGVDEYIDVESRPIVAGNSAAPTIVNSPEKILRESQKRFNEIAKRLGLQQAAKALGLNDFMVTFDWTVEQLDRGAVVLSQYEAAEKRRQAEEAAKKAEADGSQNFNPEPANRNAVASEPVAEATTNHPVSEQAAAATVVTRSGPAYQMIAKCLSKKICEECKTALLKLQGDDVALLDEDASVLSQAVAETLLERERPLGLDRLQKLLAARTMPVG